MAFAKTTKGKNPVFIHPKCAICTHPGNPLNPRGQNHLATRMEIYGRGDIFQSHDTSTTGGTAILCGTNVQAEQTFEDPQGRLTIANFDMLSDAVHKDSK